MTTRADAIITSIARVTRGEDHLHVVVATTVVAAHEAMHAGLTREEFMDSCQRAWEKSADAHRTCGS